MSSKKKYKSLSWFVQLKHFPVVTQHGHSPMTITSDRRKRNDSLCNIWLFLKDREGNLLTIVAIFKVDHKIVNTWTATFSNTTWQSVCTMCVCSRQK